MNDHASLKEGRHLVKRTRNLHDVCKINLYRPVHVGAACARPSRLHVCADE